MTQSAVLLTRLVVSDSDNIVDELRNDVESSFAAVSILKVEQITLSNGFTALTPPTGAQAVVIVPVSGAFTYTLKGVTGDTGIVMTASAIPACPVVLPLHSPSIGITCTGAGVVKVYWI